MKYLTLKDLRQKHGLAQNYNLQQKNRFVKVIQVVWSSALSGIWESVSSQNCASGGLNDEIDTLQNWIAWLVRNNVTSVVFWCFNTCPRICLNGLRSGWIEPSRDESARSTLSSLTVLCKQSLSEIILPTMHTDIMLQIPVHFICSFDIVSIKLYNQVF